MQRERTPPKRPSRRENFLLSLGKKSPLKREVFKSSPAEFSGALEWFHKNHILGDGITILVFENNTTDHPYLQSEKISQIHAQKKEEKSTEKNLDHATIVVSVLQSVAPHAFLSITPSIALSIKSSSLLNTIEKSQIINQSLGFSKIEEVFDYIEKIKIILGIGTPKLILQSAGNSGRSLSDMYAPYPKPQEGPNGTWISKQGAYNEWLRYADHRALIEYLKVPEIQKKMIIVGAVDQNYERSSFSNYPGERKIIQENFLCTLGREVASMRYKSFEYVKGTSVAAPIVTGAAALLMNMYPSLSAEDIKECLLESADRDFVIEKPDNSLTFIYDSEGPTPDVSHLERKGYQIILKPFDPAEYGKGILNLRAVRTYATLKKANPSFSPRMLRDRMNEILHFQNTEASKKIQKAFGAFSYSKKE